MSNFSSRLLHCLKFQSTLANISLMISFSLLTLCQTSHLNLGQLYFGHDSWESKHGNGGNMLSGIFIAKQIAIAFDIHLVTGVPPLLILTGFCIGWFVQLLTDSTSEHLQKAANGIDILPISICPTYVSYSWECPVVCPLPPLGSFLSPP